MFRLRYSLFVVARRCIQKCPVCAFFFRSFLLNLRRYFFFVALNSFFRSRTYLFSSQQSEGPLKVTKAKHLIHGSSQAYEGIQKGEKSSVWQSFLKYT